MSTKLLGFKGTIPNVTEQEFYEILADWQVRAESIQWSEWKDNPLQMEGLKSYKLTVRLKAEANSHITTKEGVAVP